MKQTSTVSASAMATPWQGGSYLGARSDYESTVPVTFLFKYEFRGQNSFKGERIVTPQIIP